MNTFLRIARRGLAGSLLTLSVALALPAAAQNIALYGFATATDTYTPLAGATPVTINSGGGSTDDGYSTPIALPFTFQYGTSTFNTVTLASNGYLGFGTHTTLDNYRIFRHPQENNTVGFTNVDLEPDSLGPDYSYVIEGTAPNRIWKMQAAHFQRYQGVGNVAGKTGNAQVWLYEGSNDIEIRFGDYSSLWGTGSFGTRFDSVQVGLRGVGTGDLAAISGGWQTPTKVNSSRAALTMDGPTGDLPASGLVFRFTMPGGVDLTPPQLGPVTLTPLPGCSPSSHDLFLQATDASGIQSAVLTYSVGGSTTTTVPMTSSGSTWTATIPAQGTNQVNYTIVVTDASPQGNQTTTPPAAYADGQVTVNAGTDQTITTGTSATLQATGNPTAALKITEITLNNTGTGRTFPAPAYIGNADDFIEIANIGTLDLNLGSYLFEVKGGPTGAARRYSFPLAATIPAQGVLVLHLGSGTDQPANRYFHTGGNEDLLSGSDVGFILSNPGGVIIDAVALNNYSFGPSVPGTHWSGLGAPSPGGFAGSTLHGTDTNGNAGWLAPLDTVRQTLGSLNPDLNALPLPTVSWAGGVLTGDTTANPLTTPIHATPGTYTYTATLTQNNCTVTDQTIVTVVNPVIPVADFTVSGFSGSQNTAFTFRDLSTNLPSTWQWSFAPNAVVYLNGTSATSRNPQVRLTGPGCYTVSLTATNGAGTNTRVKTAYICITLEYCTTGLQASPCSPTSDYIDAVVIQNTTLTNRGTGCNGTPRSYIAFPATDSTTTTLLGGQRYSLAVTSSAVGTVAAWIDYNGNGAFEGTEFISVIRGSTATPPVTSSVMFTVPTSIVGGPVRMRVRNSATPNSIVLGDACTLRGTGETEDYTVTLQPTCTLQTPTVRSNGPVCPGSTLTLTATGVPTGATYAWTGPNGFTSTTPAPIIPNVTATNAGTYSLRIAANGCTSTAATIAVVVNTPPAPPPALSASRCGPGSVTLRFTNIPPGISYRWYTAATGGPIASAGGGLITPALTVTTNYYVAAVQGGCESLRTTVTAIINPAPVPVLTPSGPPVICAGGSLTLTATGAPVGTPYVFKAGNTVIANNLTGVLVVTQAGNYSVTVNTLEGCSTASAALAVTVTPQSSAAFAYPASTVCRNSATPPRPAITGTAGGTFAATPSGLSINASTGQVNLGSSTAGTYLVTYTVGTTCPASQSQSITITAAPAATFAYSTGGPLCARADTLLFPTFPVGSSAGTFSATPTGLTLNAATGRINLLTSQPGTYIITNNIVAGGSCAPASSRDTITLLASPTVTVTRTGNAAFCLGDSAVLTAAAPSGTRFLWSTGDTTASIVVRQSGTYTLTGRNAGGCEATAAPQTIVVTPPTSAAFTYPAAAYCLSDTATVAPTVGGNAGGTFSASPSGLTLNAVTGSIARATSRPGTYAITYAVGGPCPSTRTDTLTFSAPPVASFAYSTRTFCVSAPDTIRPVLGVGATAGTFSATPAGLVLNPATGEVNVGTSPAGIYIIRNVVPGTGTCLPVTATDTLTIVPLPALVITGVSAQYCTGDTPALLTGTVDGVPGLGTFFVDGVPSPVLNPALLGPGPHTVLMTGSNGIGCATTTSQPFTVLASPPQPTFTVQPQGGGLVLLTSSAPTGNQWYYNGSPIPGATAPTYTLSAATQSGNYALIVSANGCVSPSSLPVAVVVTGTSHLEPRTPHLTLFPNPSADGHVQIELTGYTQPVRVEIIDAVGRIVFAATLESRTSPLDISRLPTGIYSVRAFTQFGPVVRRLVRE